MWKKSWFCSPPSKKTTTLALAQKAIDDVRAFLGKQKVNRILIYPFAHLSSNLSNPSEALKIIKAMEAYAKGKGIETFRAPFGWNKQFTISIKGHPLAEQSRTYVPVPAAEVEVKAEGECKKEEEPVSAALKAEDKMQSFWHVLMPDGLLMPIEEFKFKGHANLQKFSQYEIKKARAVTAMPPHVPLMKRLEIADYEPGSDPGNIRWYPKGSHDKVSAGTIRDCTRGGIRRNGSRNPNNVRL